ncbi:MAG: hypothetical protein LBV01_06700, partial [Deltaproteobacteria bacterium]|nr:hypothetical protein [Deltaproteobacteria bacterium]
MKQLHIPLDGSWDQYLTLFAMFDRLKVPKESHWRSLLLYFREIKDYTHFSDVQKMAIQSLLTTILEKKNFSGKDLAGVLKEYHSVVVNPYQGKIDALLREISAAIQSFQKMLSARYGDIDTLEEESINIITTDSDSDTSQSIARLRSAFSKVKVLLEDDIH